MKAYPQGLCRTILKMAHIKELKKCVQEAIVQAVFNY